MVDEFGFRPALGLVKQGLLALTVTVACCLPVWSEEGIQIQDITAHPEDNSIILNLSSPVEATLSHYDKDGQHRIVLDMQGVDIESIKNKVDMLQQLGHVPCVKKVTFSAFRGPEAPLVRMMVETRLPDTQGQLIKTGGNQLVLQLVSQSAEAARSAEEKLAQPDPQFADATPTPQPTPAEQSAAQSSAQSPQDTWVPQTPEVVSSPPPEAPASRRPEPRSHAKPPQANSLADLNSASPAEAPSPQPQHAPPKPKPAKTPPPVHSAHQPTTPKSLQPTRPQHPAQPVAVTPPQPTGPAPDPQPLPDTLSTAQPEPAVANASDTAPPPPSTPSTGLIDTLQAKTSLVVDKYMLDVKTREADDMRRERDHLLSDRKRLEILLGQRDATIRQIREYDDQLKGQLHNDKERGKTTLQMVKLQDQVRNLTKSYDEMKHARELAEKKNDDLQKQFDTLQQKYDVVQKQLTDREKYPLPSEAMEQAKNRGELLNTLASLSQNDVQELVYAEQHYRNAKKYQLEGDPEKAILEYKRARGHAPQVKTYGLELANIYFKQQRPDVARAVLNDVAKYNPDDPELMNELGKAAFLQRDQGPAMEYFRKAMPIGILNNYASALKQANKLDQAESVYRIAVEIHPDDSDLQFNLGNLYLKQRRFAEARDRFQEALRLKRDFGEARYHLGLAYMELGSTDKALEQFKKYLSENPEAPNKADLSRYIEDLEKVPRPLPRPDDIKG